MPEGKPTLRSNSERFLKCSPLCTSKTGNLDGYILKYAGTVATDPPFQQIRRGVSPENKTEGGYWSD